jgi:hypothetical protein
MPEFDDQSIKRIVEAVRYVEGQPRGTVPGLDGGREIPWNRLGITTSTLTARSSKTPGYGTVQPYYFSISTGLLVSTGSAITIKNWTSAVVPTNVWVKYIVIDGVLFYDGYDCGGGTP